MVIFTTVIMFANYNQNICVLYDVNDINN